MNKKKNHYIFSSFSSQLRAGQMPGPPREGQDVRVHARVPNSEM